MALIHRAVLVGIAFAALFRAHAAPMHPEARNVAQYFSAAVQDSFTLLADTDDAWLIYYVPRRGGVAVQSPRSTSPIPRFQIFAYYPVHGFFAGEELTSMGGAMSTTSDLGALRQLQTEAADRGFSITPAPAWKSTTKFLVTGYELGNGRIDVQCTWEQRVISNPSTGEQRTVRIPQCKTRQNPNDSYEIDTNVMYKFASFAPGNQTVVVQDIPFQAISFPGWAPQLRGLMQYGAQWDNVLTAKIDWDIKTSQLTRQARFHVNWSVLFEQASSFAAYHRNSCLEVEVQAFFERLVQCSQESACGIRMEYLQPDNTWGPRAPNDGNFVNVVNAVQQRLQDELFNEVRKYSTPRNGQVSDERTAVFTLRANYEKLILERNQVIYFSWNPGPRKFTASTTLNIACLKGGFEQGRVTWDMDDPGCRQMLGQR